MGKAGRAARAYGKEQREGTPSPLTNDAPACRHCREACMLDGDTARESGQPREPRPFFSCPPAVWVSQKQAASSYRAVSHTQLNVKRLCQCCKQRTASSQWGCWQQRPAPRGGAEHSPTRKRAELRFCVSGLSGTGSVSRQGMLSAWIASLLAPPAPREAQGPSQQ